jgi:CheY-like chemotaxis protein
MPFVCYNPSMSESSRQVDPSEFERLVRDGLANLYDQAALATHPLAALASGQPETAQSKGKQLRITLTEIIEGLRPLGAGEPAGEPDPSAPEWRPYLVLRGRYIDGVSLQSLQDGMSLSERQLRREHSRAVRAVAAILWDSLPARDAAEPGPAGGPDPLGDFPVTLAPLDTMEVLRGVVATLRRRAESEGTEIVVVPPATDPRVLADRVILRQVLVSLLSYVLEVRQSGPVTVTVDLQDGRILFRVRFRAAAEGDRGAEERDRALQRLVYWGERIDARLVRQPEQQGEQELILSLPSAEEPLLLVVDDQETAIRMFQRYLSNTRLRLVGLRDGSAVLPTARRLQPQAITLDVMMPNMDGWEVLQSLQADPATRHIPVVVCSAWEEPDLALSLGASGFLSKPIKREDLLSALRGLHLLAAEGEDAPAGPAE